MEKNQNKCEQIVIDLGYGHKTDIKCSPFALGGMKSSFLDDTAIRVIGGDDIENVRERVQERVDKAIRSGKAITVGKYEVWTERDYNYDNVPTKYWGYEEMCPTYNVVRTYKYENKTEDVVVRRNVRNRKYKGVVA